MNSQYSGILSALKKCPLVPVLTIYDVAIAGDLAKALENAGITVAEVTLRTPEALDAVKIMKRSTSRLIVGAGTILTKQDVEDVIDAESDFVVTPATDNHLCKILTGVKLPVFPGVATASEALTLYRCGFRYLKFFPAESSGGPTALRSLSAPLPNISFMPTGGITGDTAKDYLACPNVIAVGGSWMIDGSIDPNTNWRAFNKIVKAAIDQI